MAKADDVTNCSFGRKSAPRILAEVASESVDPRIFFCGYGKEGNLPLSSTYFFGNFNRRLFEINISQKVVKNAKRSFEVCLL